MCNHVLDISIYKDILNFQVQIYFYRCKSIGVKVYLKKILYKYFFFLVNLYKYFELKLNYATYPQKPNMH